MLSSSWLSPAGRSGKKGKKGKRKEGKGGKKGTFSCDERGLMTPKYELGGGEFMCLYFE